VIFGRIGCPIDFFPTYFVENTRFRNAFDVKLWLTAKIENRSFREGYYERRQLEGIKK